MVTPIGIKKELAKEDDEYDTDAITTRLLSTFPIKISLFLTGETIRRSAVFRHTFTYDERTC